MSVIVEKSDSKVAFRWATWTVMAVCLVFTFSELGQGRADAAEILRIEAAFESETGIGVAKATLRLSPLHDVQAWRAHAPLLAGDRILYPVVEPPRRLGELGAKLVGDRPNTPDQAAVWFLFKDGDPFSIAVAGAGADGAVANTVVKPKRRKPAHRRLLNEWWKAQQRWLRLDSKDADSYPPYLQMYLASVHAKRLGLRLPPTLVKPSQAGASRTLQLLTGGESLRQDTFWRSVEGSGPSQAPDLPLPAPIPFRQPTYPDDDLGKVQVESIADQVPSDCFYVRFGKYSNLLWFQHLMEEHAADLGRLVTLRGTNANYGAKLQSQLIIDKLPYAELIGDKVISDVALVGRDLCFREGAAVGLILEENAPLVKGGLEKSRRERLQKDKDATAGTIQIRGTDVSLISTPDNRIRSFYVSRDGFHLISNSRFLVDRFLGLTDGIESLGDSQAFRRVRQQLPVEREDTLFAFFSPRFFAELFEPHYRIEMQRRMRASCELDIVELATLACVNEVSHDFLGAAEYQSVNPNEDLMSQLATIRLLPRHFADREDRSRPVLQDDEWIDSRRGKRGFFLPIPDTPVTSASTSEVEDYLALGEFHKKEWIEFDPIVVAMSRAKEKSGDELEQLTIDARIMSSALGKYDRFSKRLGEPTSMQLVCDPPLLATFQASLTNRLSSDSNTVFWGALDQAASIQQSQGGLLGALALWKSAPAFLTVTDGSLLSGRLFDRLRKFDQDGYFQGVGGLWRRKHDPFTSMSYHRRVLEQVTPTTKWVESGEPPVNVRLKVGHLAESQLAAWLSAAARDRGQRSTLRNVRLMHALMTQLSVPGPEARKRAEQLVGAELVCALGGEYRWQDRHPGDTSVESNNDASGEVSGPDSPEILVNQWHSSGWSDDRGSIFNSQQEHTAAILNWCHGIDATVLKEDDVMSLQAQILLHRQPEEPKFDFSPLKFFQSKKAKPKAATAPSDK